MSLRPLHNQAWWRQEAKRQGTDWSTLLRQRIRVWWWVRAGRPPISQWLKHQKLAERH